MGRRIRCPFQHESSRLGCRAGYNRCACLTCREGCGRNNTRGGKGKHSNSNHAVVRKRGWGWLRCCHQRTFQMMERQRLLKACVRIARNGSLTRTVSTTLYRIPDRVWSASLLQKKQHLINPKTCYTRANLYFCCRGPVSSCRKFLKPYCDWFSNSN
jgi:hypothetical protein